MNKSTYSQDAVDTYSRLLDVPVAIKKKSKFQKTMFQPSAEKRKEEEEQAYTGKFVKEDLEELLNQHDFEPHLPVEQRLKAFHQHRSSFEIEDKERQCLQLSERGNLWIILALISGICYAFNNFFLGQLAKHGLLAVVYVNIPSFFIFAMIYLTNCCRNKIMHGFYWCKDISIFFKEEDNSFDWGIFLGLVLMSFSKFMAFCLVVMTFNYAHAAGMNIGIITVIFNFCCITDSIVFYYCFNERLSKGQLIGTFIMLTSAYFISKSSHRLKPPSIDPTSDQPIMNADYDTNGWYAISFALTTILFFSFRDFLLRYYRINKNYSAFELSLDALTLYSFCCTCAGLYLFTFGGYQFDMGSLYAGCMCSVLNTLGFMMLAISVVIGYAGPANALNSIQAIVLTILGVSVLNQYPSRSEVIGMMMGIFGTIFVTVGDVIIKTASLCYRSVKHND